MTTPVKAPSPPLTPYAYTPPPAGSGIGLKIARTLLTLALIPLGRYTFHTIDRLPLIGGIDVAIHEFGHYLFMPFGWKYAGETMMYAGGALTQITLPLVFAGYFLFARKHRDLHAATVCLWWSAINVIDVAIYAADARVRELTLLSGVTGQEDDNHDFYQIFSRLGVLQKDTLYAERLRTIAGIMMFVSIVAGLWVVWLVQPKPVVAED